MAELITILIDIALGALAYRLAYENRAKIEAIKAEVSDIKERLNKVELYVANHRN